MLSSHKGTRREPSPLPFTQFTWTLATHVPLVAFSNLIPSYLFEGTWVLPSPQLLLSATAQPTALPFGWTCRHSTQARHRPTFALSWHDGVSGHERNWKNIANTRDGMKTRVQGKKQKWGTTARVTAIDTHLFGGIQPPAAPSSSSSGCFLRNTWAAFAQQPARNSTEYAYAYLSHQGQATWPN